jgi:hypothetical protein
MDRDKEAVPAETLVATLSGGAGLTAQVRLTPSAHKLVIEAIGGS